MKLGLLRIHILIKVMVLFLLTLGQSFADSSSLSNESLSKVEYKLSFYSVNISTNHEKEQSEQEQAPPIAPIQAEVEIEEEIEKYDKSQKRKVYLGDLNCLHSRIEFPLYSLDIPSDIYQSIWKPPQIKKS